MWEREIEGVKNRERTTTLNTKLKKNQQQAAGTNCEREYRGLRERDRGSRERAERT
jgi:hypothetical protein